MKMITMFIFMSILISMALIFLLNYISFKMFSDREKNSPFECGFNPQNSARLPFSLQFFMMTVIFLIFDVEIALLIPMPLLMNFTNNMIMSLIASLFIMILLIGLYYEWNKGALTWIS